MATTATGYEVQEENSKDFIALIESMPISDFWAIPELYEFDINQSK